MTDESVTTFPARWFGPGAPVGVAAEARVTPTGIGVRVGDDASLWPIETVRLARSVRRGETVNLERIGTQEVLVCADPAILVAIRNAAPAHAARFPRASDIPFLARAAWIAGPLIGLTVVLFRFGIPALATTLARSVPTEWEAAFGESVIAEIAPESRRIGDPRVTAPVDRIAGRLARAAPSDYRLRIVVVDGDDVNALAAPGGHIVVFRGLLEEVRSPEELAGVLAHEIEHVRRRHVTENLFKHASLGLLIALAAGDASGPAAAGIELARTLGELSYGREAESEADQGGLATLAAARIDPRALPEFLSRLPAAAGGTRAAGFLSTHPAGEARAASVRARIAAMAPVATEPLLTGTEWTALREAIAARSKPGAGGTGTGRAPGSRR